MPGTFGTAEGNLPSPILSRSQPRIYGRIWIPQTVSVFYDEKHLLYFVAVEIVIDHTEKIAHVITKKDTEAGKQSKKAKGRQSRKDQKIAAKTTATKPDDTTSGMAS
eukprot:scaffold214587_cov46-Cyclotella_meneghiniana.AAC.1